MKVIIQASIEEDEEKIRYLEKTPKLAWAHLDQDFSRCMEDPDNIVSDTELKKDRKVLKLKRNAVSNCDVDTQTVSF